METKRKNNVEFYKKYCNILISKLDDAEARNRMNQWLYSITNPDCENSETDIGYMYLELLLWALHTNRINVFPFKFPPPVYNGDINDAYKYAQQMVQMEPDENITACQEVKTIVSDDLQEYIAVQNITNFGKHCFYAFSDQIPLSAWTMPKNIESQRKDLEKESDYWMKIFSRPEEIQIGKKPEDEQSNDVQPEEEAAEQMDESAETDEQNEEATEGEVTGDENDGPCTDICKIETILANLSFGGRKPENIRSLVPEKTDCKNTSTNISEGELMSNCGSEYSSRSNNSTCRSNCSPNMKITGTQNKPLQKEEQLQFDSNVSKDSWGARCVNTSMKNTIGSSMNSGRNRSNSYNDSRRYKYSVQGRSALIKKDDVVDVDELLEQGAGKSCDTDYDFKGFSDDTDRRQRRGEDTMRYSVTNNVNRSPLSRSTPIPSIAYSQRPKFLRDNQLNKSPDNKNASCKNPKLNSTNTNEQNRGFNQTYPRRNKPLGDIRNTREIYLNQRTNERNNSNLNCQRGNQNLSWNGRESSSISQYSNKHRQERKLQFNNVPVQAQKHTAPSLSAPLKPCLRKSN